MHYFARFEPFKEELFRFDTRIYLSDRPDSGEGRCIAAIVGKNPGSATSGDLNKLVPIDLNGDKMLPTVRNRFLQAYATADKAIPDGAFIRVWNLFYLCEPDLKIACQKIRTLEELPVCATEQSPAPMLWFGWGGTDVRLNPFKQRFLRNKSARAFYYDHHMAKVIAEKPTAEGFAKHTQGMPAQPVSEFISTLL